MPRRKAPGTLIISEMPFDLQIAAALEGTDLAGLPSLDELLAAVARCVDDPRLAREICLRICDEAESRDLNTHYRGKPQPTNVLSFPAEFALADTPEALIDLPLGDLAICWPVVLGEAKRQGKTVHAHFTHLVVHGVLHLLGYDHEVEPQAEIMENLEVKILAELGLSNPY